MKFVAGLAAARNAEASFIASRSLSRAQRFASTMGIPRAIQGYDEAAAVGGVDAIYVATPSAMHAAHTLSCLAAGIPVLVEKPFATNGAEALRVSNAARAQSVFAMEAMWTRFLPAARALKDELAAGRAGEVRLVAGNFGASEVPNAGSGRFDPALGGGAVAQLGVYPLSLAQWLFGSPTLKHAMGSLGATGIDEDAAFQLSYPGGVIGCFFASIRAWAPNDFHVMGSDGMIGFRGPIVRPYGLDVLRHAPVNHGEPALGRGARIRQHGIVHRIAQLAGRPRSRGKRINYHYAGNGYHYEADEVRACVERGAYESTVMPLDDSIAVAFTASQIRESILESADARNNPL